MMLDLAKLLFDGVIITLVISAMVLGVIWYNPRLVLNKGDIPADILAAVPPKTDQEKRLSSIMGIPFLLALVILPFWSVLDLQAKAGGNLPYWVLFVHLLGIVLMFNLFDLLVLDLLLFCTITPKFMVIPGTEGMAGYKNKKFHLAEHARAFPAVVLATALLAGVAAFY
jgi:hypothetical protein